VSLRDAFRNVRDALENVGVPYMVTGSIASSVHGIPRATQDIDVVIEPTRDQLLALMRRFVEPSYDADVDDALDAFRRRSMFSVIDRRGIWKFDFILRKIRPFSKKEFDRRRKIEILDISVFAATPEDVLLAKLEWAKLGESERQLRDAAGIIEIQGEKLDKAYVERWAAALDIEDQLHAARAKAG
jgi:hypothetical protein